MIDRALNMALAHARADDLRAAPPKRIRSRMTELSSGLRSRQTGGDTSIRLAG